ncbi:MAG: hypothetical protein JW982_14920 [Spirochaetes bacterium]|nr:hypothetical protein [Spirochaetota bacterium]
MKLSEIIRSEQDRIFVVNPECFIIFTGDSLNDERPFIRIGNWQDLPVEIIPLIENIIISDLYIGNPAFEQFNIDVKYLPKNRYIGRNLIINKFLNYQKIFGLNLDNANFINAEKDIPSISGSKAISDRESFIGIFYKDGNFKIKHNDNELLNLKNLMDEVQNEAVTHDILSRNSKKLDRFNGAGFAIIDNNPVFYENNNFITYLFPRTYTEQFNNLGISPRNISAILHPSSNYMSITKFFKWKHLSQGKITFFTDYTEKIKSVRNLFPDITMKIENFTGMKFDSPSGISIQNIFSSFNILLKTDQKNEKITYIYIKARKELEAALKLPHDFILVNYSVFEDSSYLLNQHKKPVLIHDDSNVNIKKIGRLNKIIILQNIQYILRKHNDENSLHAAYQKLLSGEVLGILESEKYEQLKDINTGDTEIFNILSYLQFQFSISANRNKSENIKRIIPSLRYNLDKKSPQIVITLHLTQSGIFQSAELSDLPEKEFTVPDILSDEMLQNYQKHGFIQRIENDRKRLYNLLNLYSNSSIYKNELRELKNAINERKKIFNEEFISSESVKKLNLDNLFESAGEQESEGRSSDSVVNKIISLFGKSGKENYGQYHTSDSSIQSGMQTSSPNYNKRSSIMSSNSGDQYSTENNLHSDKKSGSGNLFKNLSGIFMFRNRNKSSLKTGSGKAVTQKNTSGNNSSSMNLRDNSFTEKNTNKKDMQKIPLLKILLILLILAIFAGSSVLLKKSYESYKIRKNIELEKLAAQEKAENERKEKEAEEKKHAELKELYSISVSNQDIFIYANEIAVKNGYDPFPNTEFKHRNPNWIFPDNKFIFPDGQTVTVVAGDTLWDLCETKLMTIYYEFYEILRNIEKSFNESATYNQDELIKAEKLIHTPRQLKDFEKLTGNLKANDSK